MMEPTPEPTLADSLAHAPHGEGAKAVRRMLLNEAGFAYEYRAVTVFDDDCRTIGLWHAEVESVNRAALAEVLVGSGASIHVERRLVGPAERID